ncbi:MAG: FtsH protease activity modulator HflK [Gammaproteobacteria bacterium]|nr:FtsH protease activity modulator HflK [Gammaproteobacteria bacterium]
MAWNEPGGDKDPWGGNGKDQGPPDLDEVVKKLQDKMGGLFGGGKPPSGDGTIHGPGSAGIGVIVVIALLVWLASGIYIIEPAERGVILRFGSYQEVTKPGPHWHLPFPIETVEKFNVDEIASFRHQALMLTQDENIVDIELTVQSRIQDASDYWFQDQNPDKTMRDATETAVRETIGKSDLDFILTQGRGAIASQIKTRTQHLINKYRTGIEIIGVNMQPAKPPEQVKSAFDDAIKAREDKEKKENKAQAYSNEVIPVARGNAARKMADANAYKSRVIAEAEGEASRFLAVLTEYEKAPEVTRKRLYLDTIEDVLGKTNKVMIDTKDSNSLMYLPLDKLIQPGLSKPGSQLQNVLPEQVQRQSQPRQRDVNRGRRVR